MIELVRKIIRDKRSRGISVIPQDAVDVLLNDASEELTDDLISGNMIDLMIPGEGSVPVLITLAVKYLSDCPLALQQLIVCHFFALLRTSVLIFLLRFLVIDLSEVQLQ